MTIKRHYLIEISNEGREYIFNHLLIKNLNYKMEDIKKLIVEGVDGKHIPGIVRREERKNDLSSEVPIGFSSPWKIKGNRTRISCFVPSKYIENIITPYEIIKYDFVARTKALSALKEIIKFVKNFNINLGLWGSTCLEIFTSLPYTSENSDLDLILNIMEIEKIHYFYKEFLKIGDYFNIKIDLEIDLPNGYGIKAAEMFQEVNTVLGKSLTDIKLFPKTLILNILKGGDA